MNNPNVEQVLDSVGMYSAISSGTSMWPMLGDQKNRIIIKKPEREFRVNDVALFRRENGVLVLHRIIEVSSDYCLFCGDNQYCFEKVKNEQILGILKGYYKNKKYIDCEKNSTYKHYVNFWYSTLRFRKQMLKLLHFGIRIKQKLKKKR